MHLIIYFKVYPCICMRLQVSNILKWKHKDNQKLSMLFIMFNDIYFQTK